MLTVKANEKRRIEMTVNGRRVGGMAEPRVSLSDFLRQELGVFGVHIGCEHGVCGACTIVMDGSAVRSCTQRAVEAEGSDIVTVEGLAEDGRLNALQQAFRRHNALQCGFCTPGVLCSATHYLRENPHPTEAEVKDMLSGHICRCTGYLGIVNAILEVSGAATRKTEGGSI